MNVTWPDIFAGFMLMGLTLYAITGGADFGGGVWDLLARGPRATAQRQLIDTAIAPVWEANHIWLIFVVVLLFTAFPPVFAHSVATDLHVPLPSLRTIPRSSPASFQHGIACPMICR